MKTSKSFDQAIEAFIQTVSDQVVLDLAHESTQEKSRIQNEIARLISDSSIDYVEQLRRGYLTLIQSVEKYGGDASSYKLEIKSQENEEITGQNLPVGKYVQEEIGYTNDQMVELYEVASRLFDERHYPEALDAFFFLGSLMPRVSSYWIAVGSCYEKMHKTEEAFQIYRLAILLDPLEIKNWIHGFRVAIAGHHIHEIEELTQTAQKILDKLHHTHEPPEFVKELEQLLNEVERAPR